MARIKRGRWLAAASAAIVGCASPNVRAIDGFWGGFSSGDFTDASKWFVNVRPTSDGAAIFRVFGGTPAPYTVTFRGQLIFLGTRHYVNDSLRIGPNTVTLAQSPDLNLSLSDYTLSSQVIVGEGTGPTVLTTTLPITTPLLSVAGSAGSSATLNVNAGGAFTVTSSGSNGAMLVGGSSVGTVNINSGAAINVTGSNGVPELIVAQNANATINVNAGGQLNLTGIDGNAVLGVTAGTFGTVNVSGAGAVWNNNGGGANAILRLGEAGSGILNVTAGGQVNDATAYIAAGQFSGGSVTVSGAGSGWTNRGELDVGLRGTGFLAISDGGQVTCDTGNVAVSKGSFGNVQVTGAGSLWSQAQDLNVCLITGVIGTGTDPLGAVGIAGGGRIVTGHDALVGSSGSGSVTVDGAGSSWTIGGLLNVDRLGTLAVTAGGTVAANAGQLENQVTVAGAGSALRFADYAVVSTVNVGATNVATVNVTGGAQAQSRVTYLGGGVFGGAGAIVLDNPGSTWSTTDQFYTGFFGRGEVTVTRGAHLVTGIGEIAASPNSVGFVTVDGAGSRWDNGANLYVGVAGTARVTVSNGGVVASGGPLSIGPRGTVEGNGTLAANVQNGGFVAPGVAAGAGTGPLGTLTVNGNYTQTSGGQFVVEIASTSLFDRLQISGSAAVDGSLRTTLVNGFTPIPGDRFTILTSGNRTGTFQPTASLGTGALFLVPLYTPTEVILMATAGGEKTWGVDAGGNSSVASNWFGGTPVSGTPGVDDKIAFTTVITGNRTVTVDSPFTAGTIYFDDDNNYLVQGPGTITMQVSGGGNAVVSAKNLHGNGQHTISAPLQLNSRTGFDVQSPTGTLTVTQQMTAAPGVLVGKGGAGTLVVKNVRAEGLFVTTGTVRVTPDGGPGGTTILKQLVISPGARLDLNDNDLLLSYAATGVSSYGTVRAYVQQGLAFGGAAGLVSTAAQTAGNTALAVVESSRVGATSWNGFGIDDDQTIIVAYVLRGDANVDGAVGFTDLVALAQNYNNATGQASWDTGDFNYDGNVDFNDLVAIAQNYNAVLPASGVPGASSQFAQDWAAVRASVPEPSSVVITGVGGCALARRRRRINARS
jgi:T5SS/PEP-CTERM-associated repeat protein